MKLLPIAVVALLAGCGGGGGSPSSPANDQTGATTSDTSGDNPNLPIVTTTFDSLVASNTNVSQILTTCRNTYDGFNSSFLNTDSNAQQVAGEIKIDSNGQSVDAVQVQWIFTNREVATTQNTAIEANSGGAIFSIRDGGCGVDVFQGYGLNQAKTDTSQQFRNPSEEVLACLDTVPAGATTIREYALYDIAGQRYGQYRHDYTVGNTNYKQVYETQYNGSSYFIACPAAEVISTNEPALTSTRVEFNINVPVYSSNALQVRMAWGGRDIPVAWNSGQLWTASDDLPTNTENLLVITFSDNNGAITLATFEQNFRTGTSAAESYQTTATQFNTAIDDDNDGVSNINELIVGSDPTMLPPTFSSIQTSWLTSRCSGCHGSSGSAGLSLTSANAYSSLVGVGSTRKEGAVLVIANDPDNSYFLQKLEGAPDIVGRRMPNSRGMSDEQIQMVRDWIAAGALNN